jgi:hypothetical protein
MENQTPTPEQLQNVRGSISKSDICSIYNISREALRVLLNKRYFDDLKVYGYKKTDKFLPPVVYREFKKIYGEPI